MLQLIILSLHIIKNSKRFSFFDNLDFTEIYNG